MKVLFASSEVHPLVKTGGLGDVAGALPRALRALDVDVRLLIPGYPAVMSMPSLKRVRRNLQILPGLPLVDLYRGLMPDAITPVFVIGCDGLYARDGGAYQNTDGSDWVDNAQRFGILSKVAAAMGCTDTPVRWRPDIVHLNDWQSALAAAYLARMSTRHSKTVLSIHNLSFPGTFRPHLMGELGLEPHDFQVNGFEFFGRLSFLKAGLYFSDWLSTVSESYAREIQHDAHGCGFQGLLNFRRARLVGILNGIDQSVWSPEVDASIAATYSPRDLEKKSMNKTALQRRLALRPDAGVPLLGMVTRLTYQKGVDLIEPAMAALSGEAVQLAILGSGDAALEKTLRRLAASNSANIAFVQGYDEALAHQIEAGSDLFVMPSRFEPCGLNQMYSMRYGTPPVVHRTGGLADTVIDASNANVANGTATGFVFEHPDVEGLVWALREALSRYHDPISFRRIQLAGMIQDFSWERSAAAYLELYQRMLS